MTSHMAEPNSLKPQAGISKSQQPTVTADEPWATGFSPARNAKRSLSELLMNTFGIIIGKNLSRRSSDTEMNKKELPRVKYKVEQINERLVYFLPKCFCCLDFSQTYRHQQLWIGIRNASVSLEPDIFSCHRNLRALNV